MKVFFKKCKNILTRGGGRPLGKHSKGAILIEFAFAVPIMIMLLYYIHDLVRLKQIQRRMQFCGEIMVNMLQNITQNRENKAVTKTDYAHSMYAAFLAYLGSDQKIYGEKSDEQHLFYFPHPTLFCIKGLDNGKVKILWIMHPTWYKYPSNLNAPGVRTAQNDKTHINEFSIIPALLNTETNPENISKNFRINAGEIKMVLEVCFFTRYPEKAKHHFGCIITKPKPSCPRAFFNRLVIFSPRPGLFSETAPK